MLPTLVDYQNASARFEKELSLSYKKANGVYYTDLQLSTLIIKELELSKDATILDPCCGTGSFLASARLLGFQKIIGADICAEAIELCKFFLTEKNCFVCDTILSSKSEVMKLLSLNNEVDCIIGNPPYAPINCDKPLYPDNLLFQQIVKDNCNNLFIAALLSALDLLKIDGILSYIIPKNFLHVSSYCSAREYILRSKTILSIVDIGSFFKNVRGEQIVITIKNCKPDSNMIAIKKLEDGCFRYQTSIPQSIYSGEIILFYNDIDYNIYCKLNSSYDKLSDICTGYIGRGHSREPHAISGKEIRKFGFKETREVGVGTRIFLQNIYSTEAGIIASYGGSLEATETVTIITDGDPKVCRYILGMLHSRMCNFFLVRYCYNNSRLTLHTDAKYLRKIPIPKPSSVELESMLFIVDILEKTPYLSREWFCAMDDLNKLVYRIFGLTRNEIVFIDQFVKEIQSQRWNENGQETL